MAYARHDPLDHQTRSDWRAALVASVLAEINRDKKKKSEPYTVSDFMPEFGPASGGAEDEAQTPEQMLAIVELWNAAYGGVDLRDKK